MGRMNPRAERGAALTELWVLLLALIPLMFGIPMIGKLIDLRQTAVQASRYAAWETTVNEDGRAPDDVRARFFSDASAPIVSEPSVPEGNALWGADRVASAGVTIGSMAETHVAIEDASATSVAPVDAYGNGAQAGVAAGMGELIHDAGNLISDATGGEWDMEAKGLFRSGVSVNVDGNLWRTEPSTLQEYSVIMRDGWSAANDEVAATRTRSFVPAGALGKGDVNIEKVFTAAGVLPPIKELSLLKNAFGRVDMLPLPPAESGKREPKKYEEPE